MRRADTKKDQIPEHLSSRQYQFKVTPSESDTKAELSVVPKADPQPDVSEHFKLAMQNVFPKEFVSRFILSRPQEPFWLRLMPKRFFLKQICPTW